MTTIISASTAVAGAVLALALRNPWSGWRSEASSTNANDDPLVQASGRRPEGGIAPNS